MNSEILHSISNYFLFIFYFIMMMKYSIGFFLLAAYFNSWKDNLHFRWDLCPEWMHEFSGFWNPHVSWVNKRKYRGDSWFNKLIERLDDSVLVFLTDGWHLFKELMWCSVCAGVTAASYAFFALFKGVYMPFHIVITVFFIYRLTLGIGFWIGFKKREHD